MFWHFLLLLLCYMMSNQVMSTFMYCLSLFSWGCCYKYCISWFTLLSTILLLSSVIAYSFHGCLSLEFGSPERVDKYFKVNINIQVSLPYPHSEHSQVFCLKYQCWAFIHQKSIFQIWCFYLWSWIIGTFLIFIEWEFISLMRTCFIY